MTRDRPPIAMPLSPRARPRTDPRRLARDITIVLLIKLVALAGLWALLFRAPPLGDPARIVVPAVSAQENER